MPADTERMFSVREAVWWQGTSEDHGQITMLGDHPAWEDARKLAGLNWEPTEGDLHRPIDADRLREQFISVQFDAELSDAEKIELLTAYAVEAQEKVEGFKHIYRDDTDATLACVNETYNVISNADFGEIFDAVLGQDNVRFETGGCAEGGKKVWMLAKLDEPIELSGDLTVTYPYLALMSRHDATGATALRSTNVRIVCRNTFNAAELLGDRRGTGTYKFVHRGDWRDRIGEARDAVTGARNDTKRYVNLATSLLGIPVDAYTASRFIRAFIPEPPAGLVSERVLDNIEQARNTLGTIIDGPTVAGAGISGTAYGLVQAAGEYLDHVRGARTWETRLNRSLLRHEPLKARALSIVKELVDA